MDSESDSSVERTSPNVTEDVQNTSTNLLPERSRRRYNIAYNHFMEWRKAKKITSSFSENVLLAYFGELSEKVKPTSLWAKYSMLRSSLLAYHNVSINAYIKLRALLKSKSYGYKPKKSKTLTSKEIHKFIDEAPDDIYLFTKVVLIVGITGACRKKELVNLKVDDFEDFNSAALIHIRDVKTKQERSFTITGKFYEYFKKYVMLRPANIDERRFFLNYQKQKCTNQPVGINKLGYVPKEVATYLHLENPKLYTGRCFRRSSVGQYFRRKPTTEAESDLESVNPDVNESHSKSTTEILQDPIPTLGDSPNISETNVQETRTLTNLLNNQTGAHPIIFTNCTHITINFVNDVKH